MPRVTVPKSHYFSGQGRLLLGDRDANGNGYNFIPVGNCTAVAIDTTVDKFEHKESQTGDRAVDLSFYKAKSASIKFTCESLSLENLALGLHGKSTSVAQQVIVDEPHKFKKGGAIALRFPNATAITLKVGAANVPPAEYIYDAEFGTIYGNPDSAALVDDVTVLVSYTAGVHKRLDVFTDPLPAEKFLRFEGLNTINDDLVLLEAMRVSLDPIASYALINEDLANAEFTGNILQDPTIAAVDESKYFRQRLIAAV